MTQPGPNPYVLRLERLEATVADQAARIEALERVLAGIGAAFGGGGGDAASDRELDHPQYGDPALAFVPRDWKSGGVVKGQKYSCCPADFLDLLAETYAFFAEKNDREGNKDGKGNPKSVWDRKSARLARGWARRLRAGWTPPPPPAAPNFGGNGGGFGTNGGGFGAGAANPWRPNGESNGSRGFLGAAPPAAPLGSSESGPDPDPDGFDFGANVDRSSPPQPTTTLDDEEEEEPLLT